MESFLVGGAWVIACIFVFSGNLEANVDRKLLNNDDQMLCAIGRKFFYSALDVNMK